MTRLIMATVFLTIVAAAASVDRTKPPETPPLAPFRLPPVSESALSNGMQVVLVNDPRFPIVQVRLGFQAGSKFDPPKLDGLAEITGELLKEGTSSRGAKQFAEELAEIGGELNAQVSEDSLVVSGHGLAEHTGKLMVLLADMVRNANFPEEEVRLRKQNRKQELAHQLSQPDVLADKKLYEVVFGNHPYARMLPTPESIDRIDRDALAAFRDRYLVPTNAVLVLVGPVGDGQEARKLVEKSFASWEKGKAVPAPGADFPEPKRQLILVDRQGSVQADIRVGRWAVDRTHPDYFPLLMAHTIFGGGASSRMFMNIREEKGYAYDAGSSFSARRTGGLFTARTQVRNDVVEPALEAVLAEMKRMGSEAVGKNELEFAKNYRSGLFVIQLETPSGLAAQLIGVKMNGLTNDYLEKYVTNIRAVAPEQVQAVGARYIDPAKSVVVLVGDADAIAGKLEKFGEWKLENTGQ